MKSKKWDNIGFLLRSSTSVKILKTLSKSFSPMTTVQIGKVVEISKSNVSPNLTKMRKRGFVICLNPDASKWRFYKITNYGKRMLKEFEKTR